MKPTETIGARTSCYKEVTVSYKSFSILLDERDELKQDLHKAIKFLREGKAKFAPTTTNSFVDDLLKKYEEVV
jgi:hypothetical protein